MRVLQGTLCAILVLAELASAGCGRTAVRASEKEYLADPVMIFSYDPQETASDDHILREREGASGGHGAAGGGCGCN